MHKLAESFNPLVYLCGLLSKLLLHCTWRSHECFFSFKKETLFVETVAFQTSCEDRSCSYRCTGDRLAMQQSPQSFVARNSLLASAPLRFSPPVRVRNFIARWRRNIFQKIASLVHWKEIVRLGAVMITKNQGLTHFQFHI